MAEVFGFTDTGTTNGTSDVTIVPAPATGAKKRVHLITVDNLDTKSATVRIFYVDGANSRRMISKTLTKNTNLEYPSTGAPLILDIPTTSIKLNLAGAVTTTELDWTAHWAEFDGSEG